MHNINMYLHVPWRKSKCYSGIGIRAFSQFANVVCCVGECERLPGASVSTCTLYVCILSENDNQHRMKSLSLLRAPFNRPSSSIGPFNAGKF